MSSITTSIRLSPQMRRELENAARVLHRGKNWIINEALEMYLKNLNQQMLVEEARRQSLLASQAPSTDEETWEQDGDTTGWS